MNMNYSVKCSVCAKSVEQWRELVLLLKELGYKWSVGMYVAYHTNNDQRTIVVCNNGLVYLRMYNPEIIHCYGDVELFVALVAVNADPRKYHLYADGVKWYISSHKKTEQKYLARGYHEVPAEEIVEYRKSMIKMKEDEKQKHCISDHREGCYPNE